MDQFMIEDAKGRMEKEQYISGTLNDYNLYS